MSAPYFNDSNLFITSSKDLKLGVDPCVKNSINDYISAFSSKFNQKDKIYGFLPIKFLESENKYIFDTFMKNISNLSNEIFYYYKSKRNCMLNKNKLYELKEMFFENISSCHQINYLNNKYISKDPLDKLIFQESNWKIYEQKFSEETLSQNLNDIIAIFLRPNQEKDLKEKLEFFKKKYSELNDKLNEEEEESIIKEHYELGIIRNFGCDENSYKKTVIVKDVNDNYFKIFSKGNPKVILNLCKNESIPKNIYEVINQFKNQGKVIIALSGKIIKMNYLQSQIIERSKCENNMIFLGLIIIERNKKRKNEFL
jgi:magnesium-transporting ATPase (P-type)